MKKSKWTVLWYSYWTFPNLGSYLLDFYCSGVVIIFTIEDLIFIMYDCQ